MKTKQIRIHLDLLDEILEVTRKENRSPRNAVDTLLKEAVQARKLNQSKKK